jgi:hypothetical protein
MIHSIVKYLVNESCEEAIANPKHVSVRDKVIRVSEIFFPDRTLFLTLLRHQKTPDSSSDSDMPDLMRYIPA